MIGWIDASAGASGDMFLGVLADAGVPLPVMQEAVDALGLPEKVVLSEEPDARHGLHGTRVTVTVPETANDRRWKSVRALIADAPISQGTKDLALRAFGLLAEAEASVHGTSPEEVHFHEVGALDSIADIVGSAAGLNHLGLERIVCSTVTVGDGTTRGAHGSIPLPAPAVVAIARERRMPVAGEVPYEACTPTGAAVIAAAADDFGPLPGMVVDRTGLGVGVRNPTQKANVLRLVVGEGGQASPRPVVIETNVDDMDPRLWPPVLSRLMEAGASDAWLSPIVMKKGRPAHTLHVLCGAEDRETVEEAILAETTSIGMRFWEVGKRAAEREYDSITLRGQQIGVKIARSGGAVVNVSVEYRDAAAAAEVLGLPLKTVLAQAEAAAAEYL
ncbi:nickel pincer cofactor biosynthesis protein LarC [Salininema proteolyticum]|uniref:Pyridinium-3,5-bisthiocarboxylic acid mononucleotide nickel insertion protein n=1 Tax=Salininema proteolyticum TaxID=1607685 RepID=A0ABV8TT43_9ACTN